MFMLTDTGYRITFSNGFTISVGWGPHHYGGVPLSWDDAEKMGGIQEATRAAVTSGRATTCEVAVLDRDGLFLPPAYWFGADRSQHAEVEGWVSPDRLASVMNKVSVLPDASTFRSIIREANYPFAPKED